MAGTQAPLLDGEMSALPNQAKTQQELDAEWALTRFQVVGVQVFERKQKCLSPIQFTKPAYHFIDLALSFGFLPFPFLLCELWSRAFWIAFGLPPPLRYKPGLADLDWTGTILLHDSTHFFTDWGDTGFMRNFSTYSIPLGWHTVLGDITFGIGTYWVAFGTTAAEGLTPAAAIFYRTTAVLYLGVLPLTMGRIGE